jgi:DNA-binding NarL/FixJ family response regulator
MNDIKHIAIADDHTMVRKGLCALIDLFPGYKVVIEAANGKDLIDRIDPDRPPDIVLLDIVMPEMDGYRTAAWLTAHYPQSRILALSTLESESAILGMIRSGARGYLNKDAEPAELKFAFGEVIGLGYYYNDYVSKQTIRSAGAAADRETEHKGAVRLTDREQAFIQLACSEKTYQEIAAEMFVSVRTVDGYRESLFRKLHVTSRVGLALYAIRNQLVRI